MSPSEAQENGLYVFTCAAHDTEGNTDAITSTGSGPPVVKRLSPKATNRVAPTGAAAIIAHAHDHEVKKHEGSSHDHITIEISPLSPQHGHSAIPPPPAPAVVATSTTAATVSPPSPGTVQFADYTVPSAKFPHGNTTSFQSDTDITLP
jgi:hypothetical protein